MPAPNKPKPETVRMPVHFENCEVRAETFDADKRTVEVCWAAGAKVKRRSWETGPYMEELSMDPAHIRMDRMSSGAMSLLDTHDNWSMSYRLGTVVKDSIRFEGNKAYCRVQISRHGLGESLLKDLEDGMPFPVSVGYRIHAYEETDPEDEGMLPTRLVTDWEPYEISACPVQADPEAMSRSKERHEPNDCIVIRNGAVSQTAAAAARTQEYVMNKRDAAKQYGGEQLDAFAMGFGLTRNTDETDDAFRARLIAKFDENDAAEQKRKDEAQAAAAQRDAPDDDVASRDEPDDDPAELTDAQRKEIGDRAAKAERARLAEIDSVARRFKIDDQEFIDGFKARGLSVKAFREAVVERKVLEDEANPTITQVETRGLQDEVTTRRSAVANALLHRFRPNEHELTDAAREWRNMNLLETQRELMRARGEKTRGLSDVEVAGRAFHTTSDFPIILGDVVRTRLLAGYQSYQNTFQLIANRNTVTNFKEVRAARLGDNPELVKVNEHGEFPRGSMVEGSESYKIATYGRIIGMTRQMLINDDLNAFARVPSQWGRQVAKLEGDIVWGLIVNNAVMSSDNTALFHANHGNLGTPTALGVDALKGGRMAFRKQTDIDGQRIDIAPSFLFVPTDLEVEAQQMLTVVQATETKNVLPEAIRSLTPVSEHRLDAISATVWFLFANPNDLDGGLEYAYLAGHEQPHTEMREGFNTDGVEYKVRHDFGAGLTDWRFGYMNAGST